ncbi:chemotaxis protein methyltransferase CheR [Cereibacter ovatus]|uniref:Chemotaxis protein methyltransferase n=1 Tax=Cereibacter ovatus TaxID=439529 RepID=A0A285D517_9RHOB|nr:protein-glutamate O-methyltransferase [Cereibacter ovatus]SNX74902.1 chemotaxis protein methyltransferase CheR [Cereibacter ovatus]
MMQDIRHCLTEERDLPLSADDFQRIARIAHDEAGLAMADAKEALVYARLVKRLRQLSIDNFTDYIDLISQPESEYERAVFISIMTTNTTRFFREDHHFEFLAETVLPPLVAAARRGDRVRLWSAGCSSGEEPYSIAMTVLRLCPGAGSLDLKILATDIDRQILLAAQQGSYVEAALSELPEDVRKRHFSPADKAGNCQIGDEIKALVTFKTLNLAKPWPVTGPFQVIFCRNVAIYFDSAMQERVWRGFAGTLAPGGYLFIGHSERLSSSVRHQFETVGMTSYRLRASHIPDRRGKGEY